jgi:hypothetical protein
MNTFFKKPFYLSSFIHLGVFLFISFSFRPYTTSAPVFTISYLGDSAVLFKPAPDPSKAPGFVHSQLFPFFNQKQSYQFLGAGIEDAKNKRYRMMLGMHLKPRLAVLAGGDKLNFADKKDLAYFVPQHKPPVFIFHPILPAGFSLYFKDRQLAHVELSYRMSGDSGGRLLPEVKRKISSGNLEVDLLCKRYITNYLFAQRLAFSPSFWQVVKIDLSDKDDER